MIYFLYLSIFVRFLKIAHADYFNINLIMEERIINRLTKFIKARGYNDSFICQTCGLSRAAITISRKPGKDLSVRTVKKIVAQFPELNEEWLLNGTGEMLHSSFPEDSETILSRNILKRLDLLLKEENTSMRRILSNDIKAEKKYIQAHDSPTKEKALHWANVFLEKFPDYSWDWVMNGTGPTKTFGGKCWFPVLDKEQISPAYRKENATTDTGARYCYLDDTPSVDFIYKVKESDYAPNSFAGRYLGCKFREISDDGWVWGDPYLYKTENDVLIASFSGLENNNKTLRCVDIYGQGFGKTRTIDLKDILCVARVTDYSEAQKFIPIHNIKNR